MENVAVNIGQNREIIKIGNTVHRPTHWWTPAVHDLLSYLESVDFPYSPRVIGFDDKGREILSYIEGESGKYGWEKIVSDEGLKKYAKFLLSYHQAIKDYKPPENAEWAYANGAPGSGQIICHGDFGPWNIVWKGDEPIGIVDWDFVLPAKPEFDVLYALEYSAPFCSDEDASKLRAFKAAPDRKHRIGVFLSEYGIDISDVAKKVASQQREVGIFVKKLADRGLQPQADWIKNGILADVEKQATWAEQNHRLFE